MNYAYENSWNIVRNNIIKNNINGINIHWANNNQVFENIIQNNENIGLEMESSRFSRIEGNVFDNNGNYGLYLRAASHKNNINYNQFIDNEVHAYFEGSIFNDWNRNYWSNSRYIILKPIIGKLDILNIPWVDFDFYPIINFT